MEIVIRDWELCVSELRILLPGLRCWTPRGLLRRCQLRLPCRIRQVCLESKSCGIIMPDRGSGSDSEKIRFRIQFYVRSGSAKAKSCGPCDSGSDSTALARVQLKSLQVLHLSAGF
jgi:hypothetical protein